MATTGAPAPRTIDRRTTLTAALVLVVAIVGGAAVLATRADPDVREAPSTNVGPSGEVIPRTIPRPGEGRAPQDGGDRGGWEQIGLFGLILGAMAGIGVVIFRGGRSARAGRAAWREAAVGGHDGAVDRTGHLRPAPGPPATGPPDPA